MNIFDYKEIESPIEDQIDKNYKNKYANSNIPIIIDNGSYQCRAGFSIDQSPKLIFRSLVGKFKSTGNPIVGNSIKESDISRLTIKSPFDSNVLVHPPSQESIFDYLFHKLGVEQSIENPVLITEPTSNPSLCRKYMSELLFECYNIKSVVYGIDSLFSFYGNKDQFKNGGKDALIIDSSFNTTHIYNVQDYKVSHQHTKRINVGGGINTDYLRKVIHVKYPKHKSYFTQNYTNKIKENHCYFTKESFIEELKEFENDKLAREKSDIIQLPYQAVDFEKLEEEKQRKLQNRKELGIKLKEMADKKRLEKRQQQEERLQVLESILNLKLNNQLDEFNQSLKQEQFTNDKELVLEMDELKEKLYGKKEPQSSIYSEPTEDEYPLINKPDSELNAEQLKEKKKQKLLKSMRDGRIANKRKRDEEKEKEKEKEEERDRLEEEMFINNPDQYVKDLHLRRSKILDKKEQKIKSKTKVVVQRNSRLRSVLSTTQRDDHKLLGEEEVDQEELEDNKELVTLEKMLNKFDPGWNQNSVNLNGSLGGLDDQSLSMSGDYPTAEDYQVVLGVERIKTPEILFQPKALIGLDQMGLMECITTTILSQLSPDVRNLVTENIFLTGGNANTRNFRDRIHYEFTQLREPHSPLNILKSKNSSLDAWLGARKWVNDNLSQWSQYSISKEEYQEKGYDYLKDHFASNPTFSYKF